MRFVLEKKGQKFSPINQSWNIYHAYLQRMTYDNDLKVKLKYFKIITFIVLITLSAATLLW